METSKKVVNFDELRAYKKLENEMTGDELSNLDEAYRKMREFLSSNPQEIMDLRLKRRIIELEKENKVVVNKLRKSFPTHIVTYLVICSFVIGINITLLILTYMFNFDAINPYYIICALLISLTLFFTAVAAIKDWKEYISENR